MEFRSRTPTPVLNERGRAYAFGETDCSVLIVAWIGTPPFVARGFKPPRIAVSFFERICTSVTAVSRSMTVAYAPSPRPCEHRLLHWLRGVTRSILT